ncbi:MAG: hypothetical protein Q7K42_02145 [Candidatus Diapherotrites archaeon]|nr:hypothetical protein [Candidatus Diapherotrites archaeon]
MEPRRARIQERKLRIQRRNKLRIAGRRLKIDELDLVKETLRILRESPFSQNVKKEVEKFNEWKKEEIHEFIKRRIFSNQESVEAKIFTHIASKNPNIKTIARIIHSHGVPAERIPDEIRRIGKLLENHLMRLAKVMTIAEKEFTKPLPKNLAKKVIEFGRKPNSIGTIVAHLWPNSITTILTEAYMMQDIQNEKGISVEQEIREGKF